MGIIVPRKRKDGSIGYMARVRIMKKGERFSEVETFDRKVDASAWIKRRETELSKPGAFDELKQANPTLADVIDRYLSDTKRKPGRSKTQVLRRVKTMSIGSMRCSEITSSDIRAFAEELNAKPQTVRHYLSNLSAVFTVARPAWSYPLDKQAMDDARIVTKRLGIQGAEMQRVRRPTIEEMNSIMEHFASLRTSIIPMLQIIPFAMFSTRRIGEITRITWNDLNAEKNQVIIKDMKHPNRKIGNDVRCKVPEEAMRILKSVPKIDSRIFPYHEESISVAFTRAVRLCGIEDLHMHDLRREGVSRLFELGGTIPQVAAVSGHRSWQSLKIYTQLEQTGDKWAGWKWLDEVCK